jgi:hypothetical protein
VDKAKSEAQDAIRLLARLIGERSASDRGTDLEVTVLLEDSSYHCSGSSSTWGGWRPGGKVVCLKDTEEPDEINEGPFSGYSGRLVHSPPRIGCSRTPAGASNPVALA